MSQPPKNKPVPSSRIARLSRIGSLATRIAGSVISNGTTKLLSGQRPVLSDLVLTPKNIQRITDQLASLRGAAMKLGQLISMDSGELLPPELSAILARLREDADPMPKEQLQQVLDEAWGTGWFDTLLYFSYAPIAAASIGQVHKVITMQGETLAVKVQYPGIGNSIDSDVDNVASIIKLSGLLPGSFDIKPLLGEAKLQLHDEANYVREADMMTRYQQAAADFESFVVPEVYTALSTPTVLALGISPSQAANARRKVKSIKPEPLATLTAKSASSEPPPAPAKSKVATIFSGCRPAFCSHSAWLSIR